MNHLIPPPTIPLLHPQAAMGAGIVGGALPGVGLGAVPGAAGLPGAVAGVPGAQTTGAGGVGTLGGAAAAGTPGTSVATVASNPQAALAAAQLAAHGVTSSQTKEDKNQQPERLCILDLPPLMSEEKVRQLVETFGPVNAFHLLKKDDGSEMVCIVEYVDLESQEQAMDILHSNSPYRILLAEEAIQQEVIAPFFKKAKAKQMKAEDEEEEEMDGEEMSIQALLRPQVCTRVLLLSNIVDVEDLLDDKEYEEIVEDIRLECEECGGPVLSVNIPRPVRGFEHESQPEYQQKERETAAHAKKEEGDSEVKTEDAGTAMVKQEVTENAADGENEGVEKAKEAEVKDEAAGGKRSDGNEQKPATIGFAYVEFEDCEWSAKARKALNGRKFGGKIVEAHYFSEVRFRKEMFYDPKPNFLRSHSSLYNKTLAYAGPRRQPKQEEDEEETSPSSATSSASCSASGCSSGDACGGSHTGVSGCSPGGTGNPSILPAPAAASAGLLSGSSVLPAPSPPGPGGYPGGGGQYANGGA